ncbi:MAG: penicillin-binding protein 1B [Xanthomonadales bacterium]|nr:penicillin-binding protein 1B [Xanthomonadales bacterium]
MKFWRWIGRCVLLGIGGLLGFAPLAWFHLNRIVDDHFDLTRLPEPSRVYARPLELFPGMALDVESLAVELQAARYREDPSLRQPGSFAKLDKARVSLYSRRFVFDDGVEEAERLELRFAGGKLQALQGADGGKRALKRLDPALIGTLYADDPGERRPLPLHEFPAMLVAGIQAVEDRRFNSHLGVDPQGLARAMWANLRAGQLVQGGSTLTQQLVKNTLLTRERSLERKLREFGLALVIDARYDKGQILEAYLNRVYLGQLGNRPVQGFGAAAEYYFGRPLDELEVAEYALLIGLVKGPSLYDPRRYAERAMQRRNLVLRQFAETGLIGADTLERQQALPLGVSPKPSAARERHPAFIDLVQRQLQQDYSADDLASAGLAVLTTLDPIIQVRAEQAVQGGLQKIDPEGGLESAIVVTRATDGEVLALVGGRQPRLPGFNRAVTARRHVGSLLKPFVYLLALSQPQRYNLASLISDDAGSYRLRNGQVWQPLNYDRRGHGQVTLIEALSRSYNQATARLGMELGMPAFGQLLANLGVDVGAEPNPSALLGAVELSPLQVAQLYQALASGGRVLPLTPLRAVLDGDGRLLQRTPARAGVPSRVEVIRLLTLALVETTVSGTANRLTRDGRLSVDSAGKTGTSDDLRDSWYAGFTGEHLGVVWVGRDDNSSSGKTGSSGALPVWEELFTHLSSRPIRLSFGDGVRWHPYGNAEGCRQLRFLPALAPYVLDNNRNCISALTAPP